jgi:hypothetical protein
MLPSNMLLPTLIPPIDVTFSTPTPSFANNVEGVQAEWLKQTQ